MNTQACGNGVAQLGVVTVVAGLGNSVAQLGFVLLVTCLVIGATHPGGCGSDLGPCYGMFLGEARV
jgi:hypothetical protein